MAISAVAALAVAATPAAATSLQTVAGAPYTGIWGGGLQGNATFTGASGTITCNQSTFGGQIVNPGTTGAPAIGNVNDADWRKSGGASLPCDDNIASANHVDFQALDLEWDFEVDWLSDDTTMAQRNGTVTLEDIRIRAIIDAGAFGTLTCEYVGDHNMTPIPTGDMEGDLFNPDNTASGFPELRFASEPLELSNAAAFCDTSVTFTATYALAGQGGVKLQVRENPPVPPASNPPATTPTPASGGTAGQTGKPKKCKRKRGKGASSAKKKCKRKK